MAVTVESVGRREVRRRESSFVRAFRQGRPAYILLSPYLILFLIVLAYPLLYSIYLSFFDATLNRAPTFVGAGNFVQLFTDAEFYQALRNTFFFAIRSWRRWR
jgi:multiple sugar transport system permease protein